MNSNYVDHQIKCTKKFRNKSDLSLYLNICLFIQAIKKIT